MSIDAIRTRYESRTPGSRALAARAARVMPGGDTRAAGFHLPYPLVLERGEGDRVFDVDGNEYVDLANNFTSLVHGHAYPPITAAVEKVVRDGTAWPARCRSQIELAEQLVGRLDGAERLRFTNSGSEAAMLALAIARCVTGRRKILMARFGYHGSHEAFEHGAFDGRLGHCPDTLVARFGDLEAFQAVLAERGGEIAAVFLEPVMGAGGIVSAAPAFFEGVARAAREAGAVFVLDEVITFRLAEGGAQAALGLRPDLTLLGKLVGGGFPVGAVAGRAELLDVTDPHAPRVYHSGTFNGNPVTTTAGAIAVRDLDESARVRMDRAAERIERQLLQSAAARGLPCSVRRAGSLLNVYWCPLPPEPGLVRPDQALLSAFVEEAMNQGLYVTSRGMMATSSVMSEDRVDEVLQRIDATLAAMAEAAS